MTRKRLLIGGGMATLLLIGAVVGTLTFGSLFAAPPQGSDSGQGQTTMTGAEAEAIVLAAYPGASVVETDFDDENGSWCFCIELDNGVEARVDPATGAVTEAAEADGDNVQDEKESDEDLTGEQADGDSVEDEVVDNGTESDEDNDHEDEEQVVASSQAALTAAQAEAIALAEYPGTQVVETDLDNENGTLVYSVELDNGTEVTVDATIGDVVSTHQDNED